MGLAFWRPIIGEPECDTLANVAMLGLAFWSLGIGLAEDLGAAVRCGSVVFPAGGCVPLDIYFFVTLRLDVGRCLDVLPLR